MHFLKPLDLVCDFPNWRGASWLPHSKPGAGESTVAKLTIYHKYIHVRSCIWTHTLSLLAALIQAHRITWKQYKQHIDHFDFGTLWWMLFKVLSWLTLRAFNMKLQLCQVCQFHTVKWSCHTLYRDSLPLASFDFATMLHITNTCLPQGFLTIVMSPPPFFI